MEDIDLVTNIIIGLCAAGGIMRIVVLLIKIGMGEPEEVGGGKKRIKNTLIFVILALSSFPLKEIFLAYFS